MKGASKLPANSDPAVIRAAIETCRLQAQHLVEIHPANTDAAAFILRSCDADLELLRRAVADEPGYWTGWLLANLAARYGVTP